MNKVLRAISVGLLPHGTYSFEIHRDMRSLDPEYVCEVKCKTICGSTTTTWTKEEFDLANDIFQWYPALPEYVI